MSAGKNSQWQQQAWQILERDETDFIHNEEDNVKKNSVRYVQIV